MQKKPVFLKPPARITLAASTQRGGLKQFWSKPLAIHSIANQLSTQSGSAGPKWIPSRNSLKGNSGLRMYQMPSHLWIKIEVYETSSALGSFHPHMEWGHLVLSHAGLTPDIFFLDSQVLHQQTILCSKVQLSHSRPQIHKADQSCSPACRSSSLTGPAHLLNPIIESTPGAAACYKSEASTPLHKAKQHLKHHGHGPWMRSSTLFSGAQDSWAQTALRHSDPVKQCHPNQVSQFEAGSPPLLAAEVYIQQLPSTSRKKVSPHHFVHAPCSHSHWSGSATSLKETRE